MVILLQNLLHRIAATAQIDYEIDGNWKLGSSSIQYKDEALMPDGGALLKVKAGIDGKSLVQFKGGGVNFGDHAD